VAAIILEVLQERSVTNLSKMRWERLPQHCFIPTLKNQNVLLVLILSLATVMSRVLIAVNSLGSPAPFPLSRQYVRSMMSKYGKQAMIATTEDWPLNSEHPDYDLLTDIRVKVLCLPMCHSTLAVD
jgi:hypothetical protein